MLKGAAGDGPGVCHEGHGQDSDAGSQQGAQSVRREADRGLLGPPLPAHSIRVLSNYDTYVLDHGFLPWWGAFLGAREPAQETLLGRVRQIWLWCCSFVLVVCLNSSRFTHSLMTGSTLQSWCLRWSICIVRGWCTET